jgi:O-antigen ligase
MDTAKKQKVSRLIIYLFIIIFPLGQLIRIPLVLSGKSIVIEPLDAAAAICFFYYLYDRFEIPQKLKKRFAGFLFAAAASLVYSFTIFRFNDILPGLLYFLRLIFYFSFFAVVYDFCKKGKKLRVNLYAALIGLSLIIAIIGWIQYFLFPDLTSLKYLGWDDHLYRLVGSFLDPGFTSIFLNFGAILTLVGFDKKPKWRGAVLTLFFLISLAFTYSRAGYLAMLVGALYIFYRLGKLKRYFFLAIGFLALLYLLPRPAGMGVKLERFFSIESRLENYRQTAIIWSKSPVFGVGYNNLCQAKQRYFESDSASHACSGSDNSALLILATTGLVGFLIFASLLVGFWKVVGKNKRSLAFRASFLSLLVHSQFTNSIFYPWVMVFLAVLLVISMTETSANNAG